MMGRRKLDLEPDLELDLDLHLEPGPHLDLELDLRVLPPQAASGSLGCCPLGIEVEKHGFGTAWLIT